MDKVILKVEKGSIAAKLGIRPGDILTQINDSNVEDVFDYRYQIVDEKISLDIKRPDGSSARFEINKNENQDLGLVFETGLMDKPRGCANKCVFCFVDQLPKGMRESLYFKDDDPRLSFLHGNYVTLTNMSDRDIDRLAYYHLSPMNISVHTTDPELRAIMLNNPRAAMLERQLDKLINANIEMNFQVVLCKGINDGQHLDKTISDLGKLPRANSLSVVPAGLSGHRGGLYDIEQFTKEDALSVIKQIEKWQRHYLDQIGTRFVYAADEFYIKSGLNLPPYTSYEDFPQLENGVGKLAVFEREFKNAIVKASPLGINHIKIAIATAVASYPFICSLVNEFLQRLNLKEILQIDVIEVQNLFFGKSITVSGLLTGTDILHFAKNYDCDVLLIPAVALRKDSTIFLDDMELSELENQLGVRVETVLDTGHDLVNALCCFRS